MNGKIGVVGMGWVGASVAISTLQKGVASELLLCDIRSEIAEGEAMDLAHGASFYPPAAVRAASLEEMLQTDAVVICAGRGGRPGESRLELLRENAKIAAEIGRALAGYRGLVVVVSNPVDVLTVVVQRASGLPPERVIGSGTMLDTARLRYLVGEELRLDPRSLHVNVAGEHGDSQVALWSNAQVGGMPLRKWPAWTAEHEAELAQSVRGAAQAIIQRKGATNHAIGLVVATLLKWVLRSDRQRVLSISRVQEGALGIEGVALSLPTLVGRTGATQVLEPSIDEAELHALEQSAGVLRTALAKLEG